MELRGLETFASSGLKMSTNCALSRSVEVGCLEALGTVHTQIHRDDHFVAGRARHPIGSLQASWVGNGISEEEVDVTRKQGAGLYHLASFLVILPPSPATACRNTMFSA